MDGEFDEDRLYAVVNEAVRDALFYVLGTVLLVAFGGALILVGLQAAIGGTSTAQSGLGLVLLLAGLYFGTTAVGIVAPLRDWL